MHILTIVLSSLLGLAFLMAGLTKLSGQQMHVDNFDKWKLPQWFRVVTGAVELVGAVGLAAGIWIDGLTAWAGLLLFATMLGAVLVHIREKDSLKQSMPAAVLLLLSFIVTVVQLGG